MLAVYREQQPDWCPKKQSIAAMATIADNVTAQILSALKEQEMWCENDFLAPPFPSEWKLSFAKTGSGSTYV
jgi:hypothetical protein